MKILKAVNATTVQFSKSCELTFWQRAAASIGRVEAFSNQTGIYASSCLWGYMISAQLPFGGQSAQDAARTLFVREFSWANYRCAHGRFNSAPMLDRALAAVFAWALSKPAVQRVIVAQFENQQTAMCGALDRAVSQRMDRSIDADDVDGLGSFVESAVCEAIQSHEDQHHDDDERNENLVEDVIKELADRLRV